MKLTDLQKFWLTAVQKDDMMFFDSQADPVGGRFLPFGFFTHRSRSGCVVVRSVGSKLNLRQIKPSRIIRVRRLGPNGQWSDVQPVSQPKQNPS